MKKILGFALILMAASTALMAIPAAPEIDASTGSSALALIAGALLVMRSRKK
jgi:hypothetical protein